MARAKAAGVQNQIITGGSLKESRNALKLAQENGQGHNFITIHTLIHAQDSIPPLDATLRDLTSCRNNPTDNTYSRSIDLSPKISLVLIVSLPLESVDWTMTVYSLPTKKRRRRRSGKIKCISFHGANDPQSAVGTGQETSFTVVLAQSSMSSGLCPVAY